MVRTRAQDKAGDTGEPATAPAPKQGKKRGAPKKEDKQSQRHKKSTDEQHAGKVESGGKVEEEEEASQIPADDIHEEPPRKAAKQDSVTGDTGSGSSSNSKIELLLDKYGSFPLSSTPLQDPHSANPDTILAHLLNAMLSSTRISHEIAAKTLTTVIKAGYADVSQLEKSTWDERTKVLTEGGYTHYREKTATQLGDLARLVREQYDGDLNNILKTAKEKGGAKVREDVRKKIKAVKGLGEVATDVFCDTIQGLWSEIAPFIDPRSAKTAQAIGLPSDASQLFEAVGKDPEKMCKLASALTVLRLEGRESEFE